MNSLISEFIILIWSHQTHDEGGKHSRMGWDGMGWIWPFQLSPALHASTHEGFTAEGVTGVCIQALAMGRLSHDILYSTIGWWLLLWNESVTWLVIEIGFSSLDSDSWFWRSLPPFLSRFSIRWVLSSVSPFRSGKHSWSVSSSQSSSSNPNSSLISLSLFRSSLSLSSIALYLVSKHSGTVSVVRPLQRLHPRTPTQMSLLWSRVFQFEKSFKDSHGLGSFSSDLSSSPCCYVALASVRRTETLSRSDVYLSTPLLQPSSLLLPVTIVLVV